MLPHPLRSTLFPYTTLFRSSARKAPPTAASPATLLSEVRELIIQTRQTVAQGINSALVLLYWQIGQRIRTEDRKSTRLNSSHSQISYAVFCLKKNMFNQKKY